MKIALIGYGKMGKTIDQLASIAGHEVVHKIDVGNKEALKVPHLSQAEVAIEFSRPESAFNNILACFDAGVPVVSGTTGWLDRLEEMKQICGEQGGALFYASNYSIGVNIFFAINRYLANLMNEYDQYEVNMEEIHHTEKLDAPSGTAISLAKDIITQLNRKTKWVKGESPFPEDLSILSKRIDRVPGTHEINYASNIDSISIKHTAHSREGFARGAIKAAEWLIGKKGFYEMSDLLGL